MPIDGTQTVAAPIAPGSALDTYSTHIDEYGRGGYRSVTTGGSGTATNAQIGAQITLDRRKVGMLIYDTSTSKYYRCTATAGTGTYTVEDFGTTGGSVTSVGLSMPSGFTVSESPVTGVGTLTVSTALSGILKGDGSGFTTATAGTDYAAPNHSHSVSAISSGVSTSRILGRYSAGSGGVEQITIGDGVNLSASGELTATGLGGTVTNVSGQAPISVATPDSKSYIVSHATYANVAGVYGSGGEVPTFTVNDSGHIVSIAATPIAGFLPLSGGTLTGPLSGAAASFGSLTLSGDLTVNGTQTVINSTTLTVDDKNIVLGDVDSPSNATANGGGITLRGATDKSLNWVETTGAWTSSENLELATGKAFRIDGAQVLSKTALGSTVTGSSLTSVGTLTGGTWQANSIGLAYGGTGANLSGASDGAIFKKVGNALVAATAGTDYYNTTSTIDGGSY